MYLASFAALISLLNLHFPDISMPVTKLFNRPTPRELKLKRKRIELKLQQNELSITEEFAKYSKIQRQINVIDQELQELTSTRRSKTITSDLGMKYVLKLPFALVLVFMSIYYRYTPVFVLNKNFDLFPFSRLISYPNHEENAISLHFWVLCCTTVFKLIKLR